MDEEIVRSTLRGFNRVLILWLASKKSRTGSDIVKELQRLSGQKFRGNIYPLLYDLKKKGFLRIVNASDEQRKTKMYEITESGKKLLNRVRSVLSMPIKEAMEDLIRARD